MASIEKPFEFIFKNGNKMFVSLEDACILLVNGLQFNKMTDHRWIFEKLEKF